MPLNPDRFLPSGTIPDAQGLNLLIYGSAGVGKTVLCGTLADATADPVLLIDFDGGCRSLPARPNLTVFQPLTWAECSELYDLASKGTWAGLIFDSLNMAYRLCMRGVLKRTQHDMPVKGEWGKDNDYAEVNERVIRLIAAFVGLAHSQGTHLLFTAWEQTRELGTGEKKLLRINPYLSEKIQNDSRHLVDSVARLTYTGGTRTLTLRSDSNSVASKWRSPPGIVVPASLPNPTIPTLLHLMKGTTDATKGN